LEKIGTKTQSENMIVLTLTNRNNTVMNMSLLKKLFGGSGKAAPKGPEPELYKDFTIFPDPIVEGKQYRLAARIEKEIDGEVKVHQLIRADTLNSSDAAAAAAIQKAKIVIDQMGDQLFG